MYTHAYIYIYVYMLYRDYSYRGIYRGMEKTMETTTNRVQFKTKLPGTWAVRMPGSGRTSNLKTESAVACGSDGNISHLSRFKLQNKVLLLTC